MSTEILTLILSAGAAAMLTAIVQAWRSIRAGATQNERDAYTDLENSRRNEVDRRERAEIERDYWHNWSAMLEYIIRTKLPSEEMPHRPTWPPLPAIKAKSEESA